MEPTPTLELGWPGKIAAFFLFSAGLSAIFAGGQVWAVVIFDNRLLGWLPILQVAVGVGAAYLAIQLAYPRAWARWAALGALSVLACGGLPWAMWLMWHGLFTALSVFAPTWAWAALILVGVSWSGVGRVAAARKAADVETARLIAEAMASGEYGYAKPPPRKNPWILPALYLVFGAPIACFGIALTWPARWAVIDAHARGLLSGRNPFAEAWVDQSKDYPYSGSPVEWYVDYEGQFEELNKADILGFVDRIADDTSWRLSAETGVADPEEAEIALWKAGRQKELPLWIAEFLRGKEVFYHPESLFSRSFDPKVHVIPDSVHLDCDQLVYVFLHVAWRLDLSMKAVEAPFHVYLRYDGPSGEEPLYADVTGFRSFDSDPSQTGGLATTVADDFFIDADYYPSGRGGSSATEELIAAAGLYQPESEAQIKDSIVGNALVGLKENGKQDWPAEAEKHIAGSRNIVLVSNLYVYYRDLGKSELRQGNVEEAREASLRARELRAEFGSLVLYIDPEEEETLADIEAMTVVVE